MCRSMADIDSATAEIRRGIEKEEEETGQNEEIKKKKEERNRMKIYMVCPITYRATINNTTKM